MYFLVVNFHYIHEKNRYPYPGIYSTPVGILKNQIEKLGEFFDFIGQKEILEALEGKGSLPERSCLITFDDGLSSQYKNALPLLKELKVPAIFFVNAIPYAEGKACLVHKIHYSRANLSPETFLNKILDFTNREINFPNFQKLKNRYWHSDKKEAELKYILNEHLTDIERDTVIGKIFREIVDDEKSWCKKHYISKEGLLELASRSFLGIHSYSHSQLSDCSFENIEKDFKKTLRITKNIVGHSLKSVSYPYGQGNLSEAARAAKSAGLKIGFTMERSFNRNLQSPFLFARIDTNNALGGKSPIFSFKKGELVLSKLVRERRFLSLT